MTKAVYIYVMTKYFCLYSPYVPRPMPNRYSTVGPTRHVVAFEMGSML